MWLKKFLKNKQVLCGAGAVVLVLIALGVLAANGNGAHELLEVTRRDVVEKVEVSGTVEAGIVADLGFEVTGKVSLVSRREGDMVVAGETLVSLDLGTLLAERASAEADVLLKQAETRNTEAHLLEVTKEQDTLVENAYRELLSDDLVAVPASATYDVGAPTIRGFYDGSEGTYKVQIKRGVTINDHKLWTFDLEKTGPIDILEEEPTPFGTRGLFIEFPDDLSDYDDTVWYVTIPNETGASYLANFNAYEEAFRVRDRTLSEAEADLAERTGEGSIAAAELAKAEAEVARINAEIARRTLRAPFAGTITQMVVDPGEIVAANTAVASLISRDAFGVEIDLPEIDSVKVSVGDPADVRFDALSDGATLPGTVVSVNRAETVVDNVPVYEARLSFLEEGDFIRSGMTTTVAITTEERENVVAVPARAVKFREDGTTYVLKDSEGKKGRETDIVTGLRGSDGYIEILSGLSEGDIVLVER